MVVVVKVIRGMMTSAHGNAQNRSVLVMVKRGKYPLQTIERTGEQKTRSSVAAQPSKPGKTYGRTNPSL